MLRTSLGSLGFSIERTINKATYRGCLKSDSCHFDPDEIGITKQVLTKGELLINFKPENQGTS